MSIRRPVTRRSCLMRVADGVFVGMAIVTLGAANDTFAGEGLPRCTDADGRDRMFLGLRCRSRHQRSRYAGNTDHDAVDAVGHGAPIVGGGVPPCTDNDGRDRILGSSSCRGRRQRSRYAGVTDRDASDPVGQGSLSERVRHGQ